LVVVLGLVLSSGATGAGAIEFPGHPLATPGHYRGEDAAGRAVSFTFQATPTRSIVDFRVEHQSFGDAKVLGPIWHACNADGNCTQGEWKLPFAVFGYWSAPHHPKIAFEANLVR
jgi:hypothetical protein